MMPNEDLLFSSNVPSTLTKKIQQFIADAIVTGHHGAPGTGGRVMPVAIR